MSEENKDVPEFDNGGVITHHYTVNSNKELSAALALAQGEVKELGKSATSKVMLKSGGSYSFDYVPLESVLAEARRVLSKNGISFQQWLDRDEKHLTLFTELMHSSGESKIIPTPVFGSPNNMQEMGSLFTYAKRYAMIGILGIAGADDLDANDQQDHKEFTIEKKQQAPQQKAPLPNYAPKSPPQGQAQAVAPSQGKAAKLITEGQLKRLYAIHESKGWSFEDVVKKCRELFNKAEPSTLNMQEYDELVNFIQLTKPDEDRLPF